MNGTNNITNIINITNTTDITDITNTDNTDDNQDNLSYDNLNIYIKQNEIFVKFIYDASYLTYKKKIFASNINKQLELIISLFDNNICDVLMNIYILKKKNKITDKDFIIFKFIFDFVEKINNINFIDQENFFMIIIDFYKLNNLCLLIDIFFENFIFKELVNYKSLINKINDIFLKLTDLVLLFKIFNEIYKLCESTELVELNSYKKLNNAQHLIIKEKITYLANKTSYDMFMFYNSEKIFNSIISCFTHYNNFNINPELNNLTLIKNKKLLDIFESYKKIFIHEYEKNAKKCTEIYSNDIELYIKFKIDKSKLLNNIVEVITYIDKIE